MVRTIAFLALFSWTSSVEPPPMDIAVDDGCGFGYLKDAKDPDWMALVARGFSARLVPVRFVPRDIVTSTGGRKRVLQLDSGGKIGPAIFPLFLVRGGPLEWQANDFVNWYPDGTHRQAGRPEPLGVLFPGERRTYVYEKCDARALTLYAVGQASGNGGQMCLENYSLEVELEDSGTRQTIASARRVCGPDLPELLWAGDLDGDEVADLLLRVPVDRDRFDVTLYLSGSRGKGRVFGKSLTRRIPRCLSAD